eukprot:gene3962-4215_t
MELNRTLQPGATRAPGWLTKDTGASGVAQCLAPPGWELLPNASTITECAIGFYKSDWNRNPCVGCGPGLITADIGSVGRDACMVPAGWGVVSLFPVMTAKICVGNSYGDAVDRPASAASRCSTCSANMYTLDTLAGEVRTTGYTSESDCKLAPGWGQTATLVERCERGTFNPGLNRLPCTLCPNAYTTLGEGRTNISECVIQPGWMLDVQRNLPKPCDQGSYSTGGTIEDPGGNCVSCPTGFTTQGAVSARGSTSGVQCYERMQSADDIFHLSDDSAWTTDTARTAGSCEYSCRLNTACMMYRFSVDSSVCQTLLEDTGVYPSQQLAFKVSDGADYAVYTVASSLTAGVLLRTVLGQLVLTQGLTAMAVCVQQLYMTDTALQALGIKTVGQLAKWKYAAWSEALTQLAAFERRDFDSR